MSIKPEDIAPGATFIGKGGALRYVVGVQGNEVEYVMKGLLSLKPVKSGIGEFSEWALLKAS
jgi:hypothetical protein